MSVKNPITFNQIIKLLSEEELKDLINNDITDTCSVDEWRSRWQEKGKMYPGLYSFCPSIGKYLIMHVERVKEAIERIKDITGAEFDGHGFRKE